MHCLHQSHASQPRGDYKDNFKVSLDH